MPAFYRVQKSPVIGEPVKVRCSTLYCGPTNNRFFMKAIEIILQSFEPASEFSKNTKLFTTRELINLISGIIDVTEEEMANDLKNAGFKIHLHNDDGEPVGFRWMINIK